MRARLADEFDIPDNAAMMRRMEQQYDDEARARLAYCEYVDPKMAVKLRGRLERKEEAARRAEEVLALRKKQRQRAKELAEARR